jgi:16S rRNA G966 N2-methylase RsmD
MRVIAGEFRGRQLLPPEGETTRPITDRVKQSLFDILTPRLDGAIVWDLFAGTGSLGLESLSRGARQALFFETDRGAVARLRRNIEVLRLGRDRAVVQPTDVFRWFLAWGKSPREPRDPIPSPGTPGEGQGSQGKGLLLSNAAMGRQQNAPHPSPPPDYREREKIACAGSITSAAPPQADIIFLDPPYRYLRDQPEDLRRLGRQFARQHLRPEGIVVFRHDARDTLELPDLSRYDERTYGGMMLEFLTSVAP